MWSAVWCRFKQKAAVLLCALLLAGSAAAADFSQPYSHYSEREQLSSVLTDFARSYGLTAQISGNLSGLVSGRFENVEPKLFLQAMHTAYGVKSYIIGSQIYFYHEDEEKRVVFRPSSVAPSELLALISSSNLTAPELRPKLERGNVLVFTGPQIYVDNLLRLSQDFDNAQERQVVMKVFKLKHAKAQDLQISSMDRVINIPGIASILKAMVSGGSTGGGALNVTMQSAAQQSLRGQGLIAGPSQPYAPQPEETAAANGREQSQNPAGDFSPNIIADSRLNAVVIQDYRYRMPYYADVIDELDVPLRLVELHAAIVDVDINAARDLGVDWQAGRNSGNWNIAGGVGMPSWNGSFPVPTSSNGGIFSTVFETSHSRFMAQVEMLEEDNKARTLGRPSILTLDNIEATLENTTTRYIPVRGYESSDLFKVESGTVLRVTPHIIEDPEGGEPYIQLVISLQSNQESDADDSTYIGDNGEVYVAPISQTKINTQAMVRQGQSLLLGGYYTQSAQEDNSGVPGLKDAPGVGGLFGTEGTQSYTRERLLLITPRVLDIDDITLPSGLDDQRFNISPTQSDYQKRRPLPLKEDEAGGCTSNAVTQVSESTADAAEVPKPQPLNAEPERIVLQPELQ